MNTFAVTVRNQITGETATLHIQAGCAPGAQVEALTHAFRHLGWRRALAYVPEGM